MGRVLGAVLLMLVTGGAAGFAYGELSEDEPRTASRAAPLPADPSVPAPSTPQVLPNPDVPPLAVNLATSRTRLSTGRSGYVLHVDQPVGWRRNRLDDATWTWTVPTNPTNTYRLRVAIVAGNHQSVSVAKNARIAAFEEAVADGNLSDFTLESETEDTFIATYIDDGYLRVTMEKIVAFEGNAAYAAAAVTGREEDRVGLTDLVQRTTDSMEPG